MRPDLATRRKAELGRLGAAQLLVLARLEETGPDDVRLLEAIARERLASGPDHSGQLASLLEVLASRAAGTLPNGTGRPAVEEEQRHLSDQCLAREAEATFRQDLPGLLTERRGQWVAYHGSQRVGFASTDAELYVACRAQGIPDGDYIVRCIEPGPSDILLFIDSPF